MLRTLACLYLLAGSSLFAAEAPHIVSLHTQRQKATTYFMVVLRPPQDLRMPDVEWSDLNVTHESEVRRLAQLPRLVSQDKRTSAVYSALDLPLDKGRDRMLRFVGKVHGKGPAELLLLYPTERKADEDKKFALLPELVRPSWSDRTVTLDFERATPKNPFEGVRRAVSPPATEDLEGQWAQAQARELAILESQTKDFNFFALARTLTGRKYQVPARAYRADAAPSRDKVTRELFEMTTGSAAITASLAMQRMSQSGQRDEGERETPIAWVPGIDVVEHPWKKMMGEEKPDDEPLAALVPHDFYYVTFRKLITLFDLGDLIEQWGGNLLKGYEITSRDYQVRERYEKQLCLRRTDLARTLGPALVRGVALVGSDLYVREGSDVTVLFHVNNRSLFLTAVEPFVQAARMEFGQELKERKTTYEGVSIESCVTPRREVSLYRAVVGDFVIYSNSPVALRRVLDAQAGRVKSLAKALDFQYMRTVFRKSHNDEDGFAYLSDAFIRQLVGPASKIKEKRRLEALTSLRMMTDAALFVAWETGRLPKQRADLLAASGLKAEEITMPEGGDLVWDGKHQTAFSDTYNTLAFATPLIELPIEQVTALESQQYGIFRQAYLNLWRRYFDPVGMRLMLADKRVRVETYILPLIDESGYRDLRTLTGEGTTKLDLASLSPRTLAQFTIHTGPLRQWIDASYPGALGDQIFVRWDDSPKYRQLLSLWMRQDFAPGNEQEWQRRIARAAWQLPVTVGVRIGKKDAFDKLLSEIANWMDLAGSDLKPDYKGIAIRRLRFDLDEKVGVFLNSPDTPKEKRFVPVLYHAKVEGFWCISTSLDSLRDIIDRAVARRDNPGKESEQAELNSSLYLAPEAMLSMGQALHGYLDWESHRRSVANNPIWYVLCHGGLVEELDSPQARQMALRLFGFVPQSPDDSAYKYRSSWDEVTSEGYGTLRQPELHPTLPAHSPLARWLEQLRTVRVDLRFREDGVHTILTLDRHPAKKN